MRRLSVFPMELASGLEGLSNSAQEKDVIDYCEAWHEAVSAAEYISGLYVGAGALLAGQQPYDLPFQHYWRSESQVPDVPNRGYQTRLCLTTQFHLDEKSAIRRNDLARIQLRSKMDHFHAGFCQLSHVRPLAR